MDTRTGQIIQLEEIKKLAEDQQKHFVEVPVELRAHLEWMKQAERIRYWKKNKHEFKWCQLNKDGGGVVEGG